MSNTSDNVTAWYEVYEETDHSSNEQSPLAFCKYKYSAETLARYFPLCKIREVKRTMKNENKVEIITKQYLGKIPTLGTENE